MLSRVLCLLSAGMLLAQPAADPREVARKALDLLLAQKYADMRALYAPQSTITEAALSKDGAVIQAWGAAEKIGEPAVQKAGPNSVVTIPVAFAGRNVDFLFGVNPAGQLTAMFHRSAAPPYQRPSYSKPDSFRTRDVTVGDGQWKLAGALTVPLGNGPFPAVVLVHDIGPADRDETVGANRIFRDLAEGLASRGVVVLRYEKRTMQYPAASRVPKYTVQEETVTDAVAAVALVRAQPEVNPKRVYVLGHGLGGYLSSRIGEEDGKLAGLILLAANARPLEDVLVDQAAYAKAQAEQQKLKGISDKEMETLKALAAKVKKLDAADEDAPPVLGMQVSYLLDLKGYDPVAQAKTLAIPMLILQGERDFQVTMKDFNLWKSAAQGRKDVVLRSYPALNHRFMAGQGAGTDDDNRKTGSVAAEVIDDIVKWVG